MSALSPVELDTRYQEILKRVKAARAPGARPTLIAVSKKQSLEAIQALYGLGQRDFGESYVQELVAKATALRDRGCTDIRWHFIGHLQTNKVKQLLPHVHAIHTVDSERLARELAKRWLALSPLHKIPVFLEVNIDAEAEKSGVTASEAPALASLLANDTQIAAALELRGLMCIPDPDLGLESALSAFRRLKELGRALPSCQQLSMGMSDDFELALAEGATHIRVGTAIFGERS